MLRINRKAGESVVIEVGDSMIVVNVDEIRPGSVKLSVSAPPSVIINRYEIYKLKQEIRRGRKD